MFVISNEILDNTMKIVQSLEESGLLIKSVSKATENETKEQKGESFVMLIGTLAATLLGNILASKRVVKVVMELFEQAREQIEKDWIFDAVSSFN